MKVTSILNRNKMRIVGLISGGKDSIFNCMQCVAAGHEIVALANLQPHPSTGKDELDSYMFQTVGHEAVNLIAEAMGLPLYRQTTYGKSSCQTVQYIKTDSTDEVEDLHDLLKRVQLETQCQGVAVGAIASEYQRNRVEHVCNRLNLTSLSYLWKQDQAQLLKSMISAQVDAILVKVATMGLEPDKHLGISISQLEPMILKLNAKYGVNVCGEGGEYESIVLDCPLYHQKITIERSEIIKDTSGCGYLAIRSALLQPKYKLEIPMNTWHARTQNTLSLVQTPQYYAQQWDYEKINCQPEISFYTPKWTSHNVCAKDVKEAMLLIQDRLSESGMELTNIVFVNLWIRRMEDFGDVNKQYVEALGMSGVPSRACVATSLSENRSVAIEVIACEDNHPKLTVHVQSISHWAPASIGPYSQAVKIGGAIFVAGQIPLVPGTMTLLAGSIEEQVQLAMRHVSRVLSECGVTLHCAIQLTVFAVQAGHLETAIGKVKSLTPNPNTIVAGVLIKALPRFADIEILVVASENPPNTRKFCEEQVENVTYSLESNSSKNLSSMVCRIKLFGASNSQSLKALTEVINRVTEETISNLILRLLHVDQGLDDNIVQRISAQRNIAVIPVVANEEGVDIMIFGLGTSQDQEG